MKLDRWQVELEQAHVLDDQRIGAGFVKLPGELAAVFKLVIAQDGIERDEDPGPVAVGEVTEPFDFGDIVASTVTGAESRAADVDGVSAVLDGFDAEIGVLGRGEEF